MTKSLLEDRTVTKRFLFPREKQFSESFEIMTSNDKLSCYRQMRYKNAKMMIVFHGSNEVVTDYTESFAHEIDKMGINLFVAEYPGYSMSTGNSTLINILDIVPYVIKNCGTPVEKLIVFGRSLGTSYAIEAISQFPKVKGLIIESGIADFYERLERRVSADDVDATDEELKQEVHKYFNIEKKLKAYKGSTLILHTKDDRIIDAKHAMQNYEWANEPKELKLFDEGGHSDIQFCNKREYFDTVLKFVENL